MHLFFFLSIFSNFCQEKKQTKNSSNFNNFTDCKYTPCSVDCLCTELFHF